MIVQPVTDTPRLGRKNISAKTAEQAFAVYRQRFGAIAEGVDLMIDGAENDTGAGHRAHGVVESDAVAVESGGDASDSDGGG